MSTSKSTSQSAESSRSDKLKLAIGIGVGIGVTAALVVGSLVLRDRSGGDAHKKRKKGSKSRSRSSKRSAEQQRKVIDRVSKFLDTAEPSAEGLEQLFDDVAGR